MLISKLCNQSQGISKNWYIFDRITGLSRCTGFGFIESVYEKALAIELRKAGFKIKK